MYGLTLVIFYGGARYRLPLLVILIPLAGVGVAGLIDSIKREKYKAVTGYCLVLTVVSLIGSLPIPGAGDMTAYFNTHAIILKSKGKKTEAIRYWQMSSEMEAGYSSYANLSLAGVYLREKKYSLALQYLQKIKENSFAAAAKYNILGKIYLKTGRVHEAIKAFEKSLAINYSQKSTRTILIKAYRSINSQKAYSEINSLKSVEFHYK